MRFALFDHSLISDWNHDTAHFLRGNLIADHGDHAIAGFRIAYPELASESYTTLDLDRALADREIAS